MTRNQHGDRRENAPRKTRVGAARRAKPEDTAGAFDIAFWSTHARVINQVNGADRRSSERSLWHERSQQPLWATKAAIKPLPFWQSAEQIEQPDKVLSAIPASAYAFTE